MADLPEISEQDVETAAVASFRAEDHRDDEIWEGTADWEKDSYRHLARQVIAALVASGWRREADVLRDPAHECMYSKTYAQAQMALDVLLGPNEEDGCGQGLVADIYHLARRCEHFEDVEAAEAVRS